MAFYEQMPIFSENQLVVIQYTPCPVSAAKTDMAPTQADSNLQDGAAAFTHYGRSATRHGVNKATGCEARHRQQPPAPRQDPTPGKLSWRGEE